MTNLCSQKYTTGYLPSLSVAGHRELASPRATDYSGLARSQFLCRVELINLPCLYPVVDMTQPSHLPPTWLRYCDPKYFEDVEVKKSLRCETVNETIVDCKLNIIRWVKVNERDVAVLELEVRCTGPTKARIESATIDLDFSDGEPSDRRSLLNVVECLPPQLKGSSASKQIDKHGELAAKIDGGPMGGVDLGKVSKDTSKDQELLWTFTSSLRPSNDRDRCYRGIRMQAEAMDDSSYIALKATPLHTATAIEGIQTSVHCSTKVKMNMKKFEDKAACFSRHFGNQELVAYEVHRPDSTSDSYPSLQELRRELRVVVQHLNDHGEKPESEYTVLF